ncbi:MAG: MFS transporter [Candidatus Marinimicrobia bacterium]|nr:MFS transporter [Candidatus Neomarinimicrobiota bacterium]MCF7829672.1 MFS transporter [Candidatus Neomarinimicrobiota bacterium]MCF7879832.1 MFS transporter [Candidatus Neomarinimicrobiota bacterium]
MMANKKQINSWCMYDWANSAFATTVMAGFFPVFFKEYWSAGASVNESTAMLGLANSMASLIVAVLAPILGAIADQGSWKKRFLITFAYLGVLMTAGLFFVHKGDWVLASILYAIGILGFSGANIFYDSLLTDVSNDDNVDYVSAKGFSLGYLGGGVLFLVNVLMYLNPGWFGIPDGATAVRLSFLTVAVWWGLFTIPLIKWVPEVKRELPGDINFVVAGFRQFGNTFAKIRHMKVLFTFLIAYWLYIDGVDTVIRMAVDYGMSIGFEASSLIVALLITQFVGFPAALAFGHLGKRWDVKKSIYIAIGVYLAVTLYATMMNRTIEFYILAVVIGLVQGGIQALSRSYYSRLIPKNQSGEFYGFYNMLGKFAAIVGPVLIGGVGLLARNLLGFSENLASRVGIGSIVILFIAGWILLSIVDEEEGRREARILTEAGIITDDD